MVPQGFLYWNAGMSDPSAWGQNNGIKWVRDWVHAANDKQEVLDLFQNIYWSIAHIPPCFLYLANHLPICVSVAGPGVCNLLANVWELEYFE